MLQFTGDIFTTDYTDITDTEKDSVCGGLESVSISAIRGQLPCLVLNSVFRPAAFPRIIRP